MELIKALEWRRAIKKFDPSKKIKDEDLEYIKKAFRLAPSSYGLQPYALIDVSEQKIKQELFPAVWKQQQVLDADHVFVFCHKVDLSDEYIAECAELHRSLRNGDNEMKQRFIDSAGMIRKGKDTPEMIAAWAKSETFLAVGFALAACAERGVDACPLGGFTPSKVNKILGLDKIGLSVALIAALGYRSEEDEYGHLAKVRKPESLIFIDK